MSSFITQAAHWSLRNQAKSGFSAPSLEHFLSQWIRVLSQLILWEPIQSFSGPLSQFHDAVARWRTAGWVGQSGLVCYVDLWIRALDLVDRVSATVKWIRVPSHIDISCNERADVLAEEGKVSSPLYHVLSLPDRPVVCLELPSTPTPRRAPTVPRSLELHDVITPSGDTPSLCRHNAHEPRDTEMAGISRRLNFSESRNSLASSEEQLSSRTVSLNSDTSSSAG